MESVVRIQGICRPVFDVVCIQRICRRGHSVSCVHGVCTSDEKRDVEEDLKDAEEALKLAVLVWFRFIGQDGGQPKHSSFFIEILKWYAEV